MSLTLYHLSRFEEQLSSVLSLSRPGVSEQDATVELPVIVSGMPIQVRKQRTCHTDQECEIRKSIYICLIVVYMSSNSEC